MENCVQSRIKKIYKEMGITQKQIAANINMSSPAIRKLINQSDEEFKIADLRKLCDGLGISLFDFFNSEEFYSKKSLDKPYKKELRGFFHKKCINKKYEIWGYDHAGEILKSYSKEYCEIRNVLEHLNITMQDVLLKGGNESPIPKKIRSEFIKQGWQTEQEIDGTLQVEFYKKEPTSDKVAKEWHTIKGYLTGYHVDYYKNGIAIDTEWNSKDQTFDRDLAAMRAYYEAGIISLGIIITRGSELCTFPPKYKLEKYGTSTTWLNQLIERLDCRRAGGCPILAIGIKPNAINGFSRD